MGIDIHIKRIKDTPYKLVLHGHEIIGAFDHGIYVGRDQMNDKLKHAISQYHAETVVERLDNYSRGS